MSNPTHRVLRTATSRMGILRRILIRLALITLGIAAVLAMGSALALDAVSTPAPTAAPAAAPIAAPVGDGWADHDLFNPTATLNTSQVDDLRYGLAAWHEAQCIAAERVMTPDGECVEALPLWADEVDTATWNALLDAGYTWSIDLTLYEDVDVILVPADMLILDEDTVLGIRWPI